jgi:hypothetical protein
MKSSEICIPVKALALPGESGEVTPAAGDEVDFSGTATLTRIEGDKAYLAPKTVNGEQVTTAAPAAEKSLDDEESEMRADAAKSDAQPRLY